MADVKKLNNMFLVNAPAGSGKTTYIENTIINLLAQYPNRRILSITYTNRAKEELNSRINSKNVTIDTIHSFLSDFDSALTLAVLPLRVTSRPYSTTVAFLGR